MTARPTPRPLLQFSLLSLLIVMAMVAIALSAYRLWGPIAAVHYCLLLFTVGPWFAYLVSECLPVRAPQLRAAAANMILLALFIVTMRVAEETLRGPVAILVALGALILWIPQYLIFIVWRMGD